MSRRNNNVARYPARGISPDAVPGRSCVHARSTAVLRRAKATRRNTTCCERYSLLSAQKFALFSRQRALHGYDARPVFLRSAPRLSAVSFDAQGVRCSRSRAAEPAAGVSDSLLRCPAVWHRRACCWRACRRAWRRVPLCVGRVVRRRCLRAHRRSRLEGGGWQHAGRAGSQGRGGDAAASLRSGRATARRGGAAGLAGARRRRRRHRPDAPRVQPGVGRARRAVVR